MAASLSGRAGLRAICAAFGMLLCARAGGGGSAPAPAAAKGDGAGGVLIGFDPAQCGGFSPADAAAILGVPASSLTRRVEQVHGSLWICTFAAPKDGPQVVFSMEVAKSAGEAAAQMERYRENLGDEYSDLMGLGDEGVWTEVNKTVTYRKQNVIVQVQQPDGKMPQLRVVQALFAKR